MSVAVTAADKGFPTDLTSVRPLSRVYSHVAGQVTLIAEFLVAVLARYGSFSCVDAAVLMEVSKTHETFPTLRTLMRLLTVVRHDVLDQAIVGDEGGVAEFAAVRSLPSVQPHVRFEMLATGERLRAHGARKPLLP